jgi:HlyD family secretion protein
VTGAYRNLLAAALAGLAILGCEDQDAQIYQGYVEGEFVRIGVPEPGLLEELHVKRGDDVEAGVLLFALEADREIAAQEEAVARVGQARANLDNIAKGSRDPEIAMLVAELGAAQAELSLAQLNLRRRQDLAARQFASTASVDQARTDVDRWSAQTNEIAARIELAELGGRVDEIIAAEAALAAGEAALVQATWHVERRQPVAPGSARVQDTLYRPGEFVPAGGPVVVLLPPQNVLVRFFVPETVLGAIDYGDEVTLRCDGCAEPIPALITYISAEAEYTPPVIYSRDSRSKLVFLVEAHPVDAAQGLALTASPRQHPMQRTMRTNDG